MTKYEEIVKKDRVGRTDLSKLLAIRTGMSIAKSKVVIREFLDLIMQLMEDGVKDVQLSDFGTFFRQEMKGVEITDAKHDVLYKYDNKVRVDFKIGSLFSKRLNKNRKEKVTIRMSTGEVIEVPREQNVYRRIGSRSGFGQYTKAQADELGLINPDDDGELKMTYDEEDEE